MAEVYLETRTLRTGEHVTVGFNAMSHSAALGTLPEWAESARADLASKAWRRFAGLPFVAQGHCPAFGYTLGDAADFVVSCIHEMVAAGLLHRPSGYDFEAHREAPHCAVASPTEAVPDVGREYIVCEEDDSNVRSVAATTPRDAAIAYLKLMRAAALEHDDADEREDWHIVVVVTGASDGMARRYAASCEFEPQWNARWLSDSIVGGRHG